MEGELRELQAVLLRSSAMDYERFHRGSLVSSMISAVGVPAIDDSRGSSTRSRTLRRRTTSHFSTGRVVPREGEAYVEVGVSTALASSRRC